MTLSGINPATQKFPLSAFPTQSTVCLVKLRKPFFLATIASLAMSHSGWGQISMAFQTTRSYRQNPDNVAFQGGAFGINVTDGNAAITGCPLNGSPIFFGPAPLIGCQIGATGLIASGDIDRDGIRDTNTYWEIVSVQPAIAIEPFRPELVRLYAAPPSQLPRPLGLFGESSFVIWFNIQTTAIRQSPITGYNFAIPYTAGERNRMDNELVHGLYQFTFPRLGAPNVPIGLSVTHAPIPEGRIKKNNVWQGVRFLSPTRKPSMNWSADGFVQYDPRLITKICWEGNAQNIVYPQSDQLYFSLRGFNPDTLPIPNNPTAPVGDPVFPPIVGPTEARVLLPSPIDTEFVMPPFVRPVGSEAVVRLTLERALPSSLITTDRATRHFELPVRFVDTYEGWAVITFPFGSPSSVTAPDADPDGDGRINSLEWALGFNPLVADAPPAGGGLRFVQSNKKSTSQASGYWTISFPKLANHESALSYKVEFSDGDLGNWREIGNSDPNWTVEMPISSTEIVVKSKSPELSGKGFFRVKTNYNPTP